MPLRREHAATLGNGSLPYTVSAITVPPASPANVARPKYGDCYSCQETIMAEKNELASEGMKDRGQGAAKQAEGRIRSTVGSASGDTGEDLNGKAQEFKGKVQEKFSRAEQNADSDPRDDEEKTWCLMKTGAGHITQSQFFLGLSLLWPRSPAPSAAASMPGAGFGKLS